MLLGFAWFVMEEEVAAVVNILLELFVAVLLSLVIMECSFRGQTLEFLALALATIGLGWIFHRPALGVPLIALAAIGVASLFVMARRGGAFVAPVEADAVSERSRTAA